MNGCTVEQAESVELATVRGGDVGDVARGDVGAVLLGDVDPLEGLAARIASSGRTEEAFTLAALDAAAAMKLREPDAFQSLRRRLRDAGVSVGQWDEAVGEKVRTLRAVEKEHQREAARVEAARRLEADEARRAARAAERAQQPGDPLAAHHAEFDGGDVRYIMEPGDVTCWRWDQRNNQVHERLSFFSARIIGNVQEFEAPGAVPRSVLQVEAVIAGRNSTRVVEVPARDFERMEWIVPMLGPDAVVMPGRGTRDHLRVAVQKLSGEIATRRRYGYTGWVEESGRLMYLHAGGAIDAAGAVDGFAAKCAAPGDMYRLPSPPSGDLLRDALATTMELVGAEPSHIILPLVGAAFRAVLGETRLTLHVAGPPTVGKSYLARLVSSFFGTQLVDVEPLSWASPSTMKGMAGVIARIGDAMIVIDDLRDDTAVGADKIIRPHFNRSVTQKRNRDGSAHVEQASRCLLVSNGELNVRGHSLSSRVLGLELVESGPKLYGIEARARAGELAAFMSAFVRWIAPRIGEVRADLQEREREAARRWGFTDTSPRTAGLLGAVALGWSELLAFLEVCGVSIADRERLRERAMSSLHSAAGHQVELVAEESPAHRFLEGLGAVLRSGRDAHVVRLDGPSRRAVAPPTDLHLWGWYDDGNGEPRRAGRCIGYLVAEHPDAVCIEQSAAVEVLRENAKRNGKAGDFGDRFLARELGIRGHLVNVEPSPRETWATRVRIGGGMQRSLLLVKLEALGMKGQCPSDAATDECPRHPDDE